MPVGRTTKLTPDVQRKITNAIGAGNYFSTACQYAGISETTFYEWLQRGEGTHLTKRRTQAFTEFSEAVRKAEADAEISRVARIAKAGQEGTWTADAWYLERRYPERWGRRVQDVRHSGSIGSAPDYQNMTKDQLARIAAGEDPSTVLGETPEENG